MSFRPFTTEQANLKEVNGWHVGQKCQVKEFPGLWEIEGYHQYGGNDGKMFTSVYVAKLKRDGTKNGNGSSIDIGKLLPVGEAQPDKDNNGLTAAEYARQVFAPGFAKHDWYNTERQSLVKVLSISNTGRVKISFINIKKGIKPRVESVYKGQKTYSQEDSLLNLASLKYELRGEEKTFIPRLYDGEWRYWNGGEYISAPTMKMTWLLD